MRHVSVVHVFAVVILAVALSFVMTPMLALAQDSGAGGTTEPEPEVPTPPEVQNIFAWATQDPVNWRAGILFGVLGLGGALATSFFLIGSVMPGTAGKKLIDERDLQIEEMQKRLALYSELTDHLTVRGQDPPADNEKIELYARLEDGLRDDLRDERRDLSREKLKQYGLALPLYGLVGAIVSLAFAQDLLQAFLFGAGWPAVAASRGLRTDLNTSNIARAELNKDVIATKAEIEPKLVQLDKSIATIADRLQGVGVQDEEAAGARDELRDWLSILRNHVDEVQDNVTMIRPR